MRLAILLIRIATAAALLSSAGLRAAAARFDRIEAQCRWHGGVTTSAARLLPDGTISRLDGRMISHISSAEAINLSRELDRIDFDRLPAGNALPAGKGEYCLLSRTDAGGMHAIWIDPAGASGTRRAALNVAIRILDYTR
ncbi:hypothetical protein [Sphingomonas sp.]|uniref:hypothetical protein n=1 Tax=Sphingomonas sp. TaxID=28214 RepID=UPI0035B4AF84